MIETGRRHAEALGDILARQSGKIQLFWPAQPGKADPILERPGLGPGESFTTGAVEGLFRQEAFLAFGRVELTERELEQKAFPVLRSVGFGQPFCRTMPFGSQVEGHLVYILNLFPLEKMVRADRIDEIAPLQWIRGNIQCSQAF